MLCLRLLGQRHIIASSWLCKTDVCKQLSTIGLYFISRMPWVPPQVFSDMTAMIAFGVEWSTGLLGPMWFSGLGFDSLVIFPAKTCSRLKVFKVESVQTFNFTLSLSIPWLGWNNGCLMQIGWEDPCSFCPQMKLQRHNGKPHQDWIFSVLLDCAWSFRVFWMVKEHFPA